VSVFVFFIFRLLQFRVFTLYCLNIQLHIFVTARHNKRIYTWRRPGKMSIEFSPVMNTPVWHDRLLLIKRQRRFNVTQGLSVCPLSCSPPISAAVSPKFYTRYLSLPMHFLPMHTKSICFDFRLFHLSRFACICRAARWHRSRWTDDSAGLLGSACLQQTQVGPRVWLRSLI